MHSRTLYSAPTSNQTTPHYTTCSLPTLLEQYLNSTRSRDTDSRSRDQHSISFLCSDLPAELPGEVKQAGEGEYHISGLSTEQVYETVVKLRRGGCELNGQRTLTDIGLSSSLLDLSHAYQKLGGIS